MKSLRKIFLGAAIGALLSLGTAVAGDVGVNAWHYQPSLVGNWQFVMTVRFDAPDCTTAEPIPFGPNPFPGLITYHDGGTLNEYASRSPVSVRSTGFGAWKQTGKRSYRARYTFMEFDPNGLLWRTMVVESDIKLNKKSDGYTGVNRLVSTDISGNAVNICATVEGVRFET